MTKPATDKQRQYILALANELDGQSYRHLSSARSTLGLSNRQVDRLTSFEASSVIDDLKQRLDAQDRS